MVTERLATSLLYQLCFYCVGSGEVTDIPPVRGGGGGKNRKEKKGVTSSGERGGILGG